MKRIISLMSILFVVFLLVACGDTLVPSTLPSSVIDENNKDTESEIGVNELSITTKSVVNTFYPMIDCGRYEGTEFARIDINTCEYRIIDTYEELCTLTSLGEGYSKTIYDENVILALHTYRICDKYEAVGYYDFAFDGRSASIKAVCTEPAVSKEGEIVRETQYLQIPRAMLEGVETNTVGGIIDVQKEEAELLPTVQIPLENSSLEIGSAYLLNKEELNSFLEFNGISVAPMWETEEEYLVLAICHDMNTPSKPLGYKLVSSFEGKLSVERIYKSDTPLSTGAILELVSIPRSALASERYESVYLTSRQLVCREYSNKKTIVDTVIVDEQSCEYYDFLDLGIYFYDNELPSGCAYHIITTKEELSSYVASPYLEESYFESNYVVVLRLNGYNPTKTIGIKEITPSDNGISVYMDVGRVIDREHQNDELEKPDYIGPERFQAEYCYVSLPKTHIDIRYLNNNIGNVSLEVNDFDGKESYRTIVYDVAEKYSPKENATWIVVDGSDAQALRLETGIDVDISRIMKDGKFLLAYYGKAAYGTHFARCLSNENNLYVDMSYLYSDSEYDARLFAVEIDLDMLNCTSKEITVHIKRHVQLYAKMQPSPEGNTVIKDSFHASHYEDHNFKKEPENEITVLENQEAYEAFLSEHTSIELYPIVSFENCNIIAYYQYEPCTGCDDNTTFGNVRVANGRMYIDKYVEGHMGGAAMNPTIYFIAVEKAYFEDGIDTIFFIEKMSCEMALDKIPPDHTESELETYWIREDLKEKPDFDFKFITTLDEYKEIFAQYTKYENLVFDVNFEKVYILAISTEDTVSHNSCGIYEFRDLTIKNGILHLTQYPVKCCNDMESHTHSSGIKYHTLYLITMEKSFDWETIKEVLILDTVTEG